MKKIEAFITTEKPDSALSALDAIGMQATFYESNGMGKDEKYKLSYGRGVAGTTKMPPFRKAYTSNYSRRKLSQRDT